MNQKAKVIILENRIKFTKSYELYERSCKSYWHGTTQSKTPENYIPGQFPLFIEKSKGAYLWDIDGNRYTDYIMGYGAISLGYCIDEVDEAAIAQIRNGFMTSLTSPVQTQLAELLVDVIPCAERVHLCKTGSDATAAAVRLARIHTGRARSSAGATTAGTTGAAPRPPAFRRASRIWRTNMAHCSFWTRCVPASACRLAARRNTMA